MGKTRYVDIEIHILDKKEKKFFLNNFGNHFRDFTYINDVIKNLKILLFMNLKKNMKYIMFVRENL